MNCRVGDVARIVSARVASNRGALVEVLSSRPHARWLVRSLDGPRQCEDGSFKLEAVACDSDLRPVARGKAKREVLKRVKPEVPVETPRQLALLEPEAA